MLSIKKILIPIDGSALSMEAINYASSFVSEYNISVYIVTIIETNHSMYDAYADQVSLAQRDSKIIALVNERLKDAEVKAKDMGMKNVISIMRIGSPYQEIIELAKKEGIDLIIMGTHGRSGLAHLLIGSVTEKVIRTAPCPVLVVPPRIQV